MRAGLGIFTWDREERVTNRYGAFYLGRTSYGGECFGNASTDWDALRPLERRRVKFWCVVVESRPSAHVGDTFLKIKPSQPAVGEVIQLGVGLLKFGKNYDHDPMIIVKPGDKRTELWLDPRALYRLHDQTVELHVEETEESFTPAPDIAPVKSGMQGTGDGAFQVKRMSDAEVSRTSVAPKITRISPDTFMASMEYGLGEDVKKVTHPDVLGNDPRPLDIDDDD